MFEMLGRDAFGRTGVIRTRHGKIRTPTVLPVINPTRQSIAPSEIMDMGADGIITNAFLLYRNPEIRRRVLKEGVHGYLGVECPVATDSGGYQIYRGGEVKAKPEEIHSFQAEIGSDLAVVLDVPPGDKMDEDETARCVLESVDRSRDLVSSKPEGPLWYGVIHLTPHAAIRRKEAREINRMPFDVFALGSCVGSLIEYRFESHIDRVLDTCRRLRPSRPRHVFGVGHPFFLALSACFGGDLFDSAMYVLAAQGGRYLTPSGTMRVSELRELPCNCPVCVDSGPGIFSAQNGVDLLSRHNLYATFEEMRRVRQAIHDGRLWELAQLRSRSHPKLLGALHAGLRRHRPFLESVDPITKRSALFYSGPETRARPEVTRARRLAKERLMPCPTYHHPLYGEVPEAASACYPFGQTELPKSLEVRIQGTGSEIDPRETVRASIDLQFGRGCGEAYEPFEIRRSRRTGRIREIRRGQKLLGVFRAKDFQFLPTFEGAMVLRSAQDPPANRVAVSEEAAPFVAEGRSAFAKFVTECDPDVLPGQEVLLVDEADVLLAAGTAVMNRGEMLDFEAGVAARIRHVAKTSATRTAP